MQCGIDDGIVRAQDTVEIRFEPQISERLKLLARVATDIGSFQSSLRYDDAANNTRMGGYGIVNLSIEWLFAKGFTLFARGNNIFNKNYELAADFSTGGSTVFAGLRWQP